jgi:hypothetical protein
VELKIFLHSASHKIIEIIFRNMNNDHAQKRGPDEEKSDFEFLAFLVL